MLCFSNNSHLKPIFDLCGTMRHSIIEISISEMLFRSITMISFRWLAPWFDQSLWQLPFRYVKRTTNIAVRIIFNFARFLLTKQKRNICPKEHTCCHILANIKRMKKRLPVPARFGCYTSPVPGVVMVEGANPAFTELHVLFDPPLIAIYLLCSMTPLTREPFGALFRNSLNTLQTLQQSRRQSIDHTKRSITRTRIISHGTLFTPVSCVKMEWVEFFWPYLLRLENLSFNSRSRSILKRAEVQKLIYSFTFHLSNTWQMCLERKSRNQIWAGFQPKRWMKVTCLQNTHVLTGTNFGGSEAKSKQYISFIHWLHWLFYNEFLLNFL